LRHRGATGADSRTFGGKRMNVPVSNLRQQILSVMKVGRPADALREVERALTIEPRNPTFLICRAQCLAALGRIAGACEAAAAAEAVVGSEPMLWDAIGTVYSRGNDQRRALAAYNRAIALAPDNPQLLFNRAAVRRYLGELAQAEADYDRVIALKPTDYEAYRNRSDLRTQSAERNHIAELEALVAASHLDWRAAVQIHYALAKEYEDLGDYPRSFQHLQHGARIRRAHMQYDVERDLATVDWIIESFPVAPSEAMADPGKVAPSAAAPIFILGLPRSGSTLVDRILSSHSLVSSAGELNAFALAIVDAVRKQSGRAQMSRQELIAASASLDFAALGRDYLERARASGATGDYFTDKMPLNYLYCGLIRRALPNAKIIHVSRSPMAACYAMYKMLFEDGYPFSYDLQEIGRYYLAYRRLMEHWWRSMPGAMLSLRYEDLISDQLGVTLSLLKFCGLEWQEACAQFHQNPSPTTTASAAQVRRPLYDSSVSQWRHYEAQLAPLAAQLRAGGISVD
jgi:tetratricopeptide (TPR) repeat protein